MTDIRLISPTFQAKWPAEETKPETIVIAECTGVYENIAEPVHLRTHESGTICAKCGVYALVWTESEARWDDHPRNCMK